METIFVDGFDHMVTGDLSTKYNALASGVSIVSSPVRTGANCLRSASEFSYTRKTFAGSQYRTMVLGVAFQSSAFGSINNYICSFVETTSIQLRIRYIADGRIELLRGSTSIAFGTRVIAPSTWAYIEFEAYIDSVSGWANVYVDSVLDISFSGNTQALASNFCNGFLFGGMSSTYMDDLYVRGDTGNASGGTFGNCKVLTRYPQGAGTYSDLTPSAGANWQNVDETTPNGDTDYNSSSTAGHKDTYDFAALADAGAIKSVQLAHYAKKSDTGARSLKHYVKSGATEQAAAAIALNAAYRYDTKCYDTDPNTGLAWETANLDAAEFGAEVA